MSQMTRRSFALLTGTGAIAAALPSIAFAQSPVRRELAPVRLHFNENPYGPSPNARQALSRIDDLAWRYPAEQREPLIEAIAGHHSVDRDRILLGNGSAEILHLAARSYLSPRKKLVVAEPTYEALENYAATLGVPVERVPLTTRWAHDIPAMLAASKSDTGILYICNPNNPTASITPKAAVQEALGSVPAGTMVIVDEAYHHYVQSTAYGSVLPLLEKHPNLIILRTFSKIYGLAGLRIGYALAHPDAVRRMRSEQSRNNINIMALVAAETSIRDEKWVTESRQRNSDVRKLLVDSLQKQGLAVIPSQANFVMVDLGREIRPVIETMRKEGFQVGRPFPPLTTHLRITLGTEPQTRQFIQAFSRAIG
jgi:histidinol-phosphate aminotransferase